MGVLSLLAAFVGRAACLSSRGTLMNDMDQNHDELQRELLEHYRRILDIEACLKAEGYEQPLDGTDERARAAAERAKAEETLKRSEQTFRSILDNSRDGILLLDLVTERYLYISPSQAENTGFTLEELYALSLSDGVARVHPEDLQMTREQYKAAESNPEDGEDLEYRWKVKSGEYRWFRDRRKFIYNEQGKAVAMVAVSRDVTKWKNDERQITFQAHLLEKVHDAIIATDHNYRITYWNKTAEQIFRWTAEEAAGRPVSQLLRTIDRSADNLSSIRSMVQLENFSGELVFHRNDGQMLHVDVQTSVIRDAHGRLQETISTVRDITVRKQAEIQLQESEKRAKALVEKLQESDRNKSHFLSTLSHELRNPLAAMVMSLDLLEQAQGKPELRRRAEEILKRQTNLLTRLVDDLLNITRINENKIKLKCETVELVGLIQRVMTDYQIQFNEKEVGLSADLPSEPILLSADPARLNQAIGNLLQNAFKFTKCGDRVRVSVHTDLEKQEVSIAVEDTGAGIEPDILKQLFQPFTQADRTLARTQGGLGLGLSIVKGMVELHGGSVRATSAGAGQGSCFEVRLPL